MRNIPDLSTVASGGGDGRTVRACVVTSEFLGPIKNGGIATATSGLVDQLVSDGHSVTILYTLVQNGFPQVVQEDWDHWVEAFRARGIRLEAISHEGDYRDWRQKSWLAMEFLRDNEFDLVYFNEHHGSGYYALAAKRAGLSPFCEQLHCVITHGSMEWVFNTNDQYISRPEDLEMMAFERRSVEWADVVIGPSRYLLDQYQSYGWTLPKQTFHQPYALLREPAAIDSELRSIDELVFFGRLETRKGLWLFCEALDRIRDQLVGRTVTFLGRMTDFSGVSTGALIAARTRQWPFKVHMLTEFDQERALAYLRQPGRLAVMPSLADNSPCVVYECMENGIPFVTSKGSGADEIIHPDCWEYTMVDADVESLAERLKVILSRGARLGWPRFEPEQNLAVWSAWHRRIATDRSGLIAHGPRPWSSVVGQSDPLIVILDNGSSPFSLLVDGVTKHARSFGATARIIVVSPRGGYLRDFLYTCTRADLPQREGGFTVLGVDEIDAVRAAMSASEVVFLVDAEVEMLPAFFLSASSLVITGQAAALSSVCADRRTGVDALIIDDLPHGNALAVSGLGRSMGSRVWALSGEALHDVLDDVDVYDDQLDEVISAASVGHAVAHRIVQSNEEDFLFLPMVGAVSVWPDRVRRPRTRMYKEAADTARTLGVKPSFSANGAPWFAVSAFGTYSQMQDLPAIAGTSALLPDHPLSPSAPRPEEPRLLAAALGRIEVAVQIGLGEGASETEITDVIELAKRSARNRPRLDLAALLSKSDTRDFGGNRPKDLGKGKLRDRLAALAMGRIEGASGEAQIVSRELVDDTPDAVTPNMVRVYVIDDALQIRQGWITVSRPEMRRADTPTLLFVDVPVAGHQHMRARLTSADQGTASVRMVLLDQSSGTEIGSCGASGHFPGDKLDVSLELGGVHALVAVGFAFDMQDSARQALRCRFVSISIS